MTMCGVTCNCATVTPLMTVRVLLQIRTFLQRVVAKGPEEQALVECVEAIDQAIEQVRRKQKVA